MLAAGLSFSRRWLSVCQVRVSVLRRRAVSTVSTTHHSIPVGGNGSITLSVSRSAAAVGRPVPDQKVVLFLPSYGLVLPHAPDNDNEQAASRRLAATAAAVAATTPVVTVRYRLGAAHELNARSAAPAIYTYPTPVHDTLAAFDWIGQHFGRARLCVFGTHVGGSLALMLALTEARAVHAVAALDPVCDWTGLDEYCWRAGSVPAIRESASSSSSSSTASSVLRQKQEQAQKQTQSLRTKTKALPSQPADLAALLQAREQLFASPEQYFDAFASPMLFLRSAGKDVPACFPKYRIGPDNNTLVPVLQDSGVPHRHTTSFDLLAGDEYDDDDAYNIQPENVRAVQSDARATTDSADSADSTSVQATALYHSRRPRRRKALSRWPPYGLDYAANASSTTSGSLRRPAISRLQMTLPWIRLFKQESEAEPTVLARQADEMISVLQRACFFGLDKSFAEERVQAVSLRRFSAGDAFCAQETSALEQAAAWFDLVCTNKR